jgi:uncharacterized protein
MPEYLSPGVYVEEIELVARPLEGVSTSTAGFLGETLRGPLEPRLVTGFEQFKRLYGGYLPVDTSNLPFAVDGFFKNGGQRCFIGRIAAENAAAMIFTHNEWIRITAIGPGTWGNRIAAKIDPASLQQNNQPLTRFKLTVMYWDIAPPPGPPVDPTDPTQITNQNRREPTLLEVYDNLSADPASIDFLETVINGNSSLIRIEQIATVDPTTLQLNLLADLEGATPGTDDEPEGPGVTIGDYEGRELSPLPDGTVYRTGLLGFEQVDEISMVIAPDHHRVDTLDAELITHCTQMQDRFAILHSRPGDNTLASIGNLRPPQDTTYAAFYFPWIKVFNPLINQDSRIPPSGHIAGIYAKTDIERGVFKAPANEVVVGARSVDLQITKGEQDILNPRGVNCIRVFPSRGIRVWGARTASTNTLWKYINVRRYFLYLRESIDEGMQGVVFEPNDERLWARVKQTITQFLLTEWRSGALMGLKAEEAFFVKVDRTTMTQADIDNGRLICIIGVAVVKPAEFVIFRLAQFQGGSEITEL